MEFAVFLFILKFELIVYRQSKNKTFLPSVSQKQIYILVYFPTIYNCIILARKKQYEMFSFYQRVTIKVTLFLLYTIIYWKKYNCAGGWSLKSDVLTCLKLYITCEDCKKQRRNVVRDQKQTQEH